MLEGHIKFSCVPGFPALRAPPQSSTHLRDTAGRPSEHRGRRASLYNPGGPGGAARAVLPEGPGENTCTQDPEAGSCTPLTARAPPPPPKQKVRGTRRRGKKSTGSGGSRSGAFQGSAHRVSTPPPPTPCHCLVDLWERGAGKHPRSHVCPCTSEAVSAPQPAFSRAPEPLHAHTEAAHFSSLSLALPCLTTPTLLAPEWAAPGADRGGK